MDNIIKSKASEIRGTISIVQDSREGFFIQWEKNGRIERLTTTWPNIKFWKTLKGAEKKFDTMK